MTTEWYFLTVTFGQQGGVDLQTCLSKLDTIFCSYPNATTNLHTYKVTGEARVVAVIEVTNITGLERITAGISRLENVEVKCKPLLRYQTFAEWLGVEASLREMGDNTLKDDTQLYWLDGTVEYPGRTMDELLDIWKREATAVLTARSKQGHMEVFKYVAERKVIVLAAVTAADLDAMLFNLPMLREMGDGVTAVCHAVQDLKNYCSRISTEEL